MEFYGELLNALRSPVQTARFTALYGTMPGTKALQVNRYASIIRRFVEHFGEKPGLRFFSAPGRTEIGGNHTDHNRGQVLAAAITMDTIAAVCPIDNGWITIYSEGYAQPIKVDTCDLSKKPEEHASTAVVRGIAARMKELGYAIGGFEAAVTSNVLSGSGLSSSAAFEVLICTILEGLYGDASINPAIKAQICQWAENNYMNKPCGLMDQTASAVGGLVHIDFASSQPKIRKIEFDFTKHGYAMVVVGAGPSHDDLTDEYAAIPKEMKAAASILGGHVLNDVMCDQVLSGVATLRNRSGDRSVLRALHFFDENARVANMVSALGQGDVQKFFENIISSGDSSWMLLQNVYVGGGDDQSLSIALALSRNLLRGKGAWRIHGGGFAGTMLAFVPNAMLEEYTTYMNGIFGDHACCILGIRSQGAIEVEVG